MKAMRILLIFLLAGATVHGQNLPACDSLVINCCTFNVLGPNTITLEVTNYSSVLFDYPGFALFDANMDTIAVEQVNYFGIGTFPQAHTLTITAPLTLPFNGFLNLYILFYDSLVCTFPFTIPDTTTGITPLNAADNRIRVFPNPVPPNGKVSIESRYLAFADASLSVLDLQGRIVKSFTWVPSGTNRNDFDFSDLVQGFYMIRINQNGTVYSSRMVKL